MYAELAERLFRDLPLDELGLQAPLPARHAYEAPTAAPTDPEVPPTRPPPTTSSASSGSSGTARSSPGPAVERVPELRFQRPEREVELSVRGRGAARDRVRRHRPRALERHLGRARARVNRKLVDGVARVADEHAADLHATVEVVKAT